MTTATFETDPATIADVKVGNWVRVTDVLGPAWARAAEPYEFVVLAIDRDEHGVYLNQREGMLIAGQYANTVCHRIEIVRT